MKKLILCSLLLCSFVVHAADKGLDDYLASLAKATKLTNERYSSQQHSLDRAWGIDIGNDSVEYKKLMKDVSAKLIDQIKKKPSERLDVDANICAKLCIELGSSELRKKIVNKTGGIANYSKATLRCQEDCKLYDVEYLGYYQGMLDALNLKNKEAGDCTGNVLTNDRKTSKDSVMEHNTGAKASSAVSK